MANLVEVLKRLQTRCPVCSDSDEGRIMDWKLSADLEVSRGPIPDDVQLWANGSSRESVRVWRLIELEGQCLVGCAVTIKIKLAREVIGDGVGGFRIE